MKVRLIKFQIHLTLLISPPPIKQSLHFKALWSFTWILFFYFLVNYELLLLSNLTTFISVLLIVMDARIGTQAPVTSSIKILMLLISALSILNCIWLNQSYQYFWQFNLSSESNYDLHVL